MMIRIDPVVFFTILEVCILFFAIALFLFLRNRKQSVSKIYANKKRREFEEYLQGEIARLNEIIDGFKNTLGKEKHVETAIVRENHLTRLRFLSTVLEEFKKHGKDSGLLWEKVFQIFDGMFREMLQRIKSFELDRAEDSDEVTESNPEEELQKPSAAPVVNYEEQIVLLQQDNDSLKRNISQLESELKESSRAYSDLKDEMKSLEKEYLVLYNQSRE